MTKQSTVSTPLAGTLPGVERISKLFKRSLILLTCKQTRSTESPCGLDCPANSLPTEARLQQQTRQTIEEGLDRRALQNTVLPIQITRSACPNSDGETNLHAQCTILNYDTQSLGCPDKTYRRYFTHDIELNRCSRQLFQGKGAGATRKTTTGLSERTPK